MRIGNRKIGQGFPLFFIAEAGVNHNGSVHQAKKLIDVAVDAGADAVKFQTYIPEKLASSRAEKAEYQKKTTNPDQSQLEMLEELALTKDDFESLKQYCETNDIIFLSSPFDAESLDVLLSLGVDAIKIPSGEITNHWLLEKIDKAGLPVILSTGMSTLGEIEDALTNFTNSEVSLLHCVSSYPTPPDQINLNAINTLRESFKLVTGFSDHTQGINIPFTAAALNANIIEKHFTLDKELPGPDHEASLEPNELKQLISAIREMERALGDGIVKVEECEKENREVARKSLVTKHDMNKGDIVTRTDLVGKRPGTGLGIDKFHLIDGKPLRNSKKKDEVIYLKDF